VSSQQGIEECRNPRLGRVPMLELHVEAEVVHPLEDVVVLAAHHDRATTADTQGSIVSHGRIVAGKSLSRPAVRSGVQKGSWAGRCRICLDAAARRML
jgi:hypothetical protein